MLFLGDFSYYVHPFYNNEKWDTFGLFIEKSSVYKPGRIYSAGNHKFNFASEIVRLRYMYNLNNADRKT
ncbi:putative purple acid phosphatase [Helianthus annuus]|nr:putative metallo-dependent phosphatase [Helianthus annuus]KAJ0906583.1 putative purple acid phosphatase [Helianthus annuus]